MNSRGKGIALSYVNTALNMVCGFFLSSFLLRCLGSAEYGVYQTIASFANSLVMLQFGTGTVMTRNVAMCRAREASTEEIESNITTIIYLMMALVVVIAGISWLFYGCIDALYTQTMDLQQLEYAKKLFVLVTISLIISFCTQTFNGVILAYEHYTFGVLQSIFHTIFKTLGQSILVFFFRRAILIVLVDLTINVVLLAVSVGYIIHQLGIIPWRGKWDKQILLNAAPMCIAAFLQTITNQVNNNVDKFLIGIKMSLEAVSLYSVAMYVYSVFSTVMTIPITMYAPMVLKAEEKHLPLRELEQSLVEPCRYTAITGGLIYFGFIAAGESFITLVYGKMYTKAWIIAILVMTPMYINMVNGVLVNILDARNKRLVRSVILMITTICNAVLTMFWLDRWGVVGAAMATMLCTFLGQVLMMNMYYQKKMKIRVLWLFRESFKGVLIWLVLACVAGWFAGNVIQSVLGSFIISMVVYLSVFMMGYIFFGMSQEEKRKLNRLLHRGKVDG